MADSSNTSLSDDLDNADYYELIDVESDASEEKIQKRTRKLLARFHPDVCDHKDGEKIYKKLSQAKETLTDPDKREIYDTLGHQEYIRRREQTGTLTFFTEEVEQTSYTTSRGGRTASQTNVDGSGGGADNDHKIRRVHGEIYWLRVVGLVVALPVIIGTQYALMGGVNGVSDILNGLLFYIAVVGGLVFVTGEYGKRVFADILSEVEEESTATVERATSSETTHSKQSGVDMKSIIDGIEAAHEPDEPTGQDGRLSALYYSWIALTAAGVLLVLGTIQGDIHPFIYIEAAVDSQGYRSAAWVAGEADYLIGLNLGLASILSLSICVGLLWYLHGVTRKRWLSAYPNGSISVTVSDVLVYSVSGVLVYIYAGSFLVTTTSVLPTGVGGEFISQLLLIENGNHLLSIVLLGLGAIYVHLCGLILLGPGDDLSD